MLVNDVKIVLLIKWAKYESFVELAMNVELFEVFFVYITSILVCDVVDVRRKLKILNLWIFLFFYWMVAFKWTGTFLTRMAMNLLFLTLYFGVRYIKTSNLFFCLNAYVGFFWCFLSFNKLYTICQAFKHLIFDLHLIY